MHSGVSRTEITPPDVFTMTTMIKLLIYDGDRLVLKNNQHAPDRYSRVYLIKESICRLSVCN